MHPILTHLTNTSPWLLVAFLLTGVLLWLAGHKLLRGGTLLAGLLAGAALVASVIPPDVGAGWLLAWVVLGAGMGAALAWLMFRITTGTAMGAAMAVVMCVGYGTWQSLPAPVLFEDANPSIQQTSVPEEVAAHEQQSAQRQGQASLAITHAHEHAESQLALAPLSRFETQPEREQTGPNAAPPAAVMDSLKFDWQLPVKTIEETSRETVSSVVERARANDSYIHAAAAHLGQWGRASGRLGWHATANLGVWWLNLPLPHQVALVLVAGLAAVLGMILGIAMPYTAAAAETSLVGAAIGIPAAIGLSYFFMQKLPGLMPQTPTAWVFTLAAATLVGTIAQYWLWQRETPEEHPA